MKRVLIVVDDPAVRTLVAIFLEHLGYAVDEAADLALARMKLRCSPPAAVFVVTHPGCLPARAFLDVYADECARQPSARPAPVALIMADVATEVVTGSPVRAVLRMPFSLDELAATAWSLVEPETACSIN